MKPVTKIAIVAGGYVVAIVLAVIAAALSSSINARHHVDTSGGMSAFGDLLLVIGVFAVAATVPTGFGLFFLRPYRAFWNVISGISMAIALTSVIAALLFTFGHQAPASSTLAILASISVLCMLAAPLLAIAFLVGAVVSAHRIPRSMFVAATLMEVAVIGTWFAPMLLNRH